MPKNTLAVERSSTKKEVSNGKSDRNEGAARYWFPVYEGIFEHAAIMADSVWLFMWLIARTTDDGGGKGKVLGGVPINDGRPARELGFSVKTIRRWRQMLVRGAYIAALRTPYGFVYTLLKSKKWPTRTLREFPKLAISTQESAQNGHGYLPLREVRVPEMGNTKKTSQGQYKVKSVMTGKRGSIDRRTSERDSTNQLYLTGKTWDELDLTNLPRAFQDFVDLVQRNPYGQGEGLVDWGQRILNLCGKGGIEYPKVFLKRIKDAERIESAVVFPKAQVYPL